jgi:hypothetical protein
MVSQKIVTPVKTGVQTICNHMKRLDSGFRRNDKKWCYSNFYEFIKVGFACLKLTAAWIDIHLT